MEALEAVLRYWKGMTFDEEEQDRRDLHAGDDCPRCQGELFEITPKTRDAMLSRNPVIRSVPMKYLRSVRSTYVICPACDAYACGIEEVDGFDLLDKSGNHRSIHEILNGREF